MWHVKASQKRGRSRFVSALAFLVLVQMSAPVWAWGRLAGGSGTGPILLSQATFVLAHIANSGPVPLSAVSRFPLHIANSGPVPLSAAPIPLARCCPMPTRSNT